MDRVELSLIGMIVHLERPATVDSCPEPAVRKSDIRWSCSAPNRAAFEPANQRRTRQIALRGGSRRLSRTGSDLSVWLWAAGHRHPEVREPRSLRHLAQPRTVPRAAPKAAVGTSREAHRFSGIAAPVRHVRLRLQSSPGAPSHVSPRRTRPQSALPKSSHGTNVEPSGPSPVQTVKPKIVSSGPIP